MQATEFKIGDIVTWKSASNEFWDGGKAKVISLKAPLLSSAGQKVTVEVLESIPKNQRNTLVGAEIQEYSSSLALVPEEAVAHPAHYGGDTTYEVIKVAEAWGLDKDAYLFNVIKYVGRAGKKAKSTLVEDLKKARFYLDRRIKALEEELSTVTSS